MTRIHVTELVENYKDAIGISCIAPNDSKSEATAIADSFDMRRKRGGAACALRIILDLFD